MIDDNTKPNNTSGLKEQIPPQQSPVDTTNWDNKVSTDPSGKKYIRSDQGEN